VDLAGILLKTAAYGLLRFALPLFPNASAEFAPIAMTLGLIGIFYGAFLAFAQTDIKRLIAFSSVSHMGFVLIGIYSGSQLACKARDPDAGPRPVGRRAVHPVRPAVRAPAHP
jgi:NADH-quinone oxidoreductase subunit M